LVLVILPDLCLLYCPVDQWVRLLLENLEDQQVLVFLVFLVVLLHRLNLLDLEYLEDRQALVVLRQVLEVLLFLQHPVILQVLAFLVVLVALLDLQGRVLQ
jgi:hypothetical protein